MADYINERTLGAGRGAGWVHPEAKKRMEVLPWDPEKGFLLDTYDRDIIEWFAQYGDYLREQYERRHGKIQR
jgi:hypothetical protein